ncbi:nucleotide exchange factor GrpE [Cellulophaga tyrosinoxydans]|jgi:molecular chaperone GrpE|uniref:Protein GrpE n=1 Tax=Cellulophaga tyrosinoxydans TaxID=504486 RepID=A0A1W2AKY5_9FLAO|nr:nucleotide exchange factor GrpE [Cellulophaga tyrosinoxydans]SMC61346.1 molecular chaperone GrpE [Cellulophaga tyrosinoxydans]
MSDKNNIDEILDGNLNEEVQDKEQEQVENVEVEELSVEDQLKEDLAKEKDKFLRLFAEFENYKKRTSKERMDLFRTAGQEVIVALLPVSDDFDRALQELSKSEDKEMFKGVELIQNKFKQVLKAKGLEEVEAKPGDVFDADLHEAITQIPAPDKKMKGKIIDVIEKGFKLGDKIIRHPKVVVGN